MKQKSEFHFPIPIKFSPTQSALGQRTISVDVFPMRFLKIDPNRQIRKMLSDKTNFYLNCYSFRYNTFGSVVQCSKYNYIRQFGAL